MNQEEEAEVGHLAEYGSANEAFSIKVWHWFSLDQAIAATTFSRKCGELESNPNPPSQEEQDRGLRWSMEDQREHRSYVIASVLSSVAFLEASINELLASASHGNLEVGGGLSPDERSRLTATADLIAKNNFLDKFQLTLYLLGRTPFDRGTQPYQNAKVLVTLRNELVHYKPQFHEGGATEPAELVKWLKPLADRRFPLNPFANAANPFFPDRCLSHGCTVWAWNTALSFADDFFTRLGVTPIYGGLRQSLIP